MQKTKPCVKTWAHVARMCIGAFVLLGIVCVWVNFWGGEALAHDRRQNNADGRYDRDNSYDYVNRGDERARRADDYYDKYNYDDTYDDAHVDDEYYDDEDYYRGGTYDDGRFAHDRGTPDRSEYNDGRSICAFDDGPPPCRTHHRPRYYYRHVNNRLNGQLIFFEYAGGVGHMSYGWGGGNGSSVFGERSFPGRTFSRPSFFGFGTRFGGSGGFGGGFSGGHF